MDKAQLELLERALDQRRAQLTGQGDHRLAPNRDGDTTSGSDEDGQALNEMHQAIASRRNRGLSGSLQQIDEALERLREEPEEFGLCQDCEEPIPFRRLELIPYAAYCVRCQSRQEQDPAAGGPVRRKLGDYV